MSLRRVLSCSRWDLEEGLTKLLLVAAGDGVRKVGHLKGGAIWLIADCEEAHSSGKGAGISRPMGFSIG